MKPAESLDGNDIAFTQEPARFEDRRHTTLDAGNFGGTYRERLADLAQRDEWPAIGTGNRLGMEAAIQRILIFVAAAIAHAEFRHRREGAVIGNVLDDREARSTVGAVNEGIEIAPIARIEQLAFAVRA